MFETKKGKKEGDEVGDLAASWANRARRALKVIDSKGHPEAHRGVTTQPKSYGQRQTEPKSESRTPIIVLYSFQIRRLEESGKL